MGGTGQRLEAEIGLYFYNARFYDATLGRFAQADTIVPGARNVLALDRYAYVQNNSLRYNDPSGHFYEESPGGIYIPPPKPPMPGGRDAPGLLGGNGSGDDDHEPTDNLIIQISDNEHIVIMPPGSWIKTTRQPWMERLGYTFMDVGMGIDLAEIAAIALVADLTIVEVFLSGADTVLTVFGGFLSGENYVGQPHPDLPSMLVFNQDAIVSSTDLALETVLPVIGDLITTGIDGLHGAARIAGLQNHISIGIGRDGIYILIYPEP